MRLPTLLTLALLLATSVAFAADVALTPPRLELSGAPGETVTAEVRLFTREDAPQEVAVALGDWTLEPDGALRTFDAGTLEHSAAPWIALQGDALEIPAAGEATYRISVTIPPDAEGGYHAMVFFETAPPDAGGEGVRFQTRTRLGLAVYVNAAGTERPEAALVDLYHEPESSDLRAVVVNDGNVTVRLGGTVEVRDESGATVRVLSVPDVPVLRGGEREVALPLPDDLPPGFYVALTFLEAGGGGPIVGELPFEIR